MRELGEHSAALHAGLASAILDAHVDELILIGEEMRPLAEQIVGKVSLDLVGNVDEAIAGLLARLHPGDAVLVKASNSVGLAKLVDRVARGVACST
jgi:UDP-N-acetylmuramoyl-tripeptide--D-alanyl-D-alanine ligase